MWDYAGDGYVHRLIQNKADGKLVELPSAASSMGTSPHEGGLGPSPADALSAEKIEAIGIEYSYLLTSQLDSQRSYYEEQTEGLKNQIDQLRGMMAHMTSELERAKSMYTEEVKTRREEEETRISQIEKDKAKVESRAEAMSQLARKLKKELDEERAVSAGLMKNLANIKEKAETEKLLTAESRAKIQDLEDQLRDVMFYLEASNKIENAEGAIAEAQGGSLSIKQSPKKKPKK